MAFDKKYKNVKEKLCPICKESYIDGRSIIEKSYHKGTGKMCSNCMSRYYRNFNAGRTAAYTDDSANPLVRLRPAPILERPRLLHKDRPRCGYEYVMPELCTQQICQDLVVWVVLCLTIGVLSKEHISILVIGTVMTIVSVVWMIYDFYRLLKGILLGMGHIRRLLLLGSILVKLFLAWHFAQQVNLILGKLLN